MTQKNSLLLSELLERQLKNIPSKKRLHINDLKRISKFIGSSIFDADKCSLWNGYITNANNTLKGIYVNFYFRNKKVVLHRLLYTNFIGDLEDDEYLKFSCSEKGKCCNINHIKKFRYSTSNTEKSKKSLCCADKDTISIINEELIDDPASFIIDFD